jgi:hypothetical protein
LVQDPRTEDVGVAAVQTAFEGAYVNTRDKCSDFRWPMTGSTAERLRSSRLIFGVTRRFCPEVPR